MTGMYPALRQGTADNIASFFILQGESITYILVVRRWVGVIETIERIGVSRSKQIIRVAHRSHDSLQLPLIVCI